MNSVTSSVPVSYPLQITKSPLNVGLEELSKFVFTSKYSRFRPKLGRRENWNEAVRRVEDMHVRKFPQFSQEIHEAFNYVRDKKVLPAMRHLQFGGAAIENNNLRGYNCCVRHIDSIDAFSEVFYALLCGCGVGIGITPYFINQLPNLVRKNGSTFTYVIPDTIEGWAESIKVLLKSFFWGNELSKKQIVFDYSEIRPEGTLLKTSGGKAPGPSGLRKAHKLIDVLLTKVSSQTNNIRPIHAYDIIMHCSDAVLSGGIRRSSCVAVFDKNDVEMMSAKTGNWMSENPQRARSNNSVLLVREEIDSDTIQDSVEMTKQFGEPGFVFANHPFTLYNPCLEVGFIPVTSEKECGIQVCNLSTINGSKVDSPEKFYEFARIAAFIGTLQATYTDFPYLSPIAKQLTEEESLLGVSILAMMENPEVLLNSEYQKRAAIIINETNEIWAKKLGIKPAARTTVIKPDGTVSLACGTLASGIHPVHSEYMVRRVQVNRLEPVYELFKGINPDLCEKSKWGETDDVITFPIINPETALVKENLTAIQHLEMIKSTQENWVNSGKTKYNTKDCSHSVSCSVIVRPDEWDEVIKYLYENNKYFSAVSLIPATLDTDFPQAPNQKVSLEEVQRLQKLLKPVDYSKLSENYEFNKPELEVACAGGSCAIA